MPRAISGSPQDLKLLKAGLCPDCGAAVTAGMVACAVCKVTFGVHASVLAPVAAAAGAPAPRGAPAAALARAPVGSSPAASTRGLTTEQIDELERGMSARSLFPHTFAEGPENGSALALGSALARAAQLVMADAALADDPLVLASGKAPPSAIPRVTLHAATSSAAMVDDAPPMTSFPPAAARAPVVAHAPSPRARVAAPPPVPRAAPAASAAPVAPVAPVAPAASAAHGAPVAHVAPVAAAIPPSEEPATLPEQPAFDPDATLKHDADELARTIKAAQQLIAARGGAQRLE